MLLDQYVKNGFVKMVKTNPYNTLCGYSEVH